MEEKIKLLLEFLESEMTKNTEDFKEIGVQLNKQSRIPDDEFATNGDPELGAKNKASLIEGLKLQKAVHSGILSQTERFENILKMNEAQIKSLMSGLKMAREQSKARREDMRENTSEAIMNMDSNFHIEWCACHGTDKPWAISEECECPGAYIIRKRMKEGMSFEEAKIYVIKNESI